jgi:WD40 repeat protein
VLRELKGHSGEVDSVSFTPDGKRIVSSADDTTIRIWDIASGAELARLFSFGLDDWAVVSPDGRFDASPEAMKMLYWRYGNQIVESDQLRKKLCVPGLLQAVVSGK